MGFMSGLFSNANLGFGLSAISTGMSMAAAQRDAEAQNMANQAQAAQYQQQADLDRIRAANASELGGIEAAEKLKQYETLRGEQRVAYGASGVNVNVGSAAQMQANTAAEGVYEAAKSQYNRDLQAWEYNVNAVNLEGQANILRTNTVNPWIPTATAGIGGLTNMYRSYSGWENRGLS